ncbi:TPA: cysteine peptidase family C39 domain-containing protein, partial [Vibrio parahaemolyticus]
MDIHHHNDYGLYALEILAQYHNVSINPEEIKHKFDINGTGLDLTSWLLAAKSLELKVKPVKKTVERLNFIYLPALVWREDGHHFILTKVSKESNKYLIYDLEQRNPRVLEQAEFEELYQGNIILITSRTSIIGKLAKFDFTWFIPAIIKYRKIFIETLVVSI